MPSKAKEEPKGVSYSAPPGTEVSTTIDGGKNVRLTFEGTGKRGTFTTADPAIIQRLDDCATAENHPIAFQTKEE
jgi:hypothetical protein